MGRKIEETVDEVKSFTLPNKTIIVRHIPRSTPLAPNVDEDHIAYGGMLTDAICSYSAPLQRNGAIKNVLTTQEKEYLESITDLNLSIYGDFWETFRVTLRKDKVGRELDLQNPIDYISYRILCSLDKSEIAPSWNDRNKILSYRFAITETDEMLNNSKAKFNLKKEAFKAYGRIENSTERLMGVLKLLSNKPISPNTTLSMLQDKVSEYVDNEPSKFLGVVNDESFDTKSLILEGVEKGVINKTGNRYVTIDGLELCEAGEIPIFTNAVRYLEQAKNQDVRHLIEAKINK